MESINTIAPSVLGLREPEDARVRILRALNELSLEGDFAKVSVSAICARAQISRPTFYRRFKDKYAVVEWHMTCAHDCGINEVGRTLSWHEGYFITTMMIARYASLYMQNAKTHDINSVCIQAANRRRAALFETFENHKHRKITEKMAFEIDSLIGAEIFVLPLWLEKNLHGITNETIEGFCSWMCDAVPRDLYESLKMPIARYSTSHEFSAAYISQLFSM